MDQLANAEKNVLHVNKILHVNWYKNLFRNILVTAMVREQIEGNAATVIVLKATFLKNETKNPKLILHRT